MGYSVPFKGTNRLFTAPEGDEVTRTTPAFSNGKAIVTAWILSNEEVEDVVRTGRVFVSVLSGDRMHPLFVGSSKTVRDLMTDTGGTIPHQPDLEMEMAP